MSGNQPLKCHVSPCAPLKHSSTQQLTPVIACFRINSSMHQLKLARPVLSSATPAQTKVHASVVMLQLISDNLLDQSASLFLVTSRATKLEPASVAGIAWNVLLLAALFARKDTR